MLSKTVPLNTEVTVKAIPDVGYVLQHWLLDGELYKIAKTTVNVLMDQDHTLTAIFHTIPEPTPELVTLEVDRTIGGTLSYPTLTVEINKTILVTAHADKGYTFDHWILDGKKTLWTQSNIAVYMHSNRSLRAVFTPLEEPEVPPEEPDIANLLFVLGVIAVVSMVAIAGSMKS